MKSLKITIIALATVATAHAGGLMTNTNHGAAFLRDMARGTTTAVDAVYFNPAGTAFMKDGIHWGFNEQVAIQDRVNNSTLASFALYEKGNGTATNEFKATTLSPVIPSVDFVKKSGNLAWMGSLSVGGGGGTLKFNDGLSDYVGQIGLGVQKAMLGAKYDMDMFLKGTSITATLQFGAAYKLTKNFAVAAQIRSNIGYAKYDGHLRGITANGNPISALNPAFADRELSAKQTGVAFSPNFAVSYAEGSFAYSGKYEFKSAIKLKNKTDKDEFGLFPDGYKNNAEMPALLTQAISYRFGKNLGYLKITGEWHHFFDTDAKNSFSVAETSGSNEYLLGAEVYVNPKLELSTAYQRTVFSLEKDAYSEMNYNMNSHSIGLGGAYAINEKMKLNLGCMVTLYQAVERVQENFAGVDGLSKTDKFDRHNLTLGVGLEYNF